jgi:hypothetical protein
MNANIVRFGVFLPVCVDTCLDSCEFLSSGVMWGMYDTSSGAIREPLVGRNDCGVLQRLVLYYPSRRLCLLMFPGGLAPSSVAVLHASLPCASGYDVVRAWFDRDGQIRGFFQSDRVSGNNIKMLYDAGFLVRVARLVPGQHFALVHGCFFSAPTLEVLIASLACEPGRAGRLFRFCDFFR